MFFMLGTQLNFGQCCKLISFWKAGYLQKDIALELGVHASTICRELKRNEAGMTITHQNKLMPDTNIGVVNRANQKHLH